MHKALIGQAPDSTTVLNDIIIIIIINEFL